MAPQKRQPPKIAHRPAPFGYKWAAKYIKFGESYWTADPFKDKFMKAAEYYDIVDTWTRVLANEGKDKSLPELFIMFIWHVGARDTPCTTLALRLGAIEGRNRELAGVQTYGLNGIDPETGMFTLPFSWTWDCFQKLGWMAPAKEWGLDEYPDIKQYHNDHYIAVDDYCITVEMIAMNVPPEVVNSERMLSDLRLMSRNISIAKKESSRPPPIGRAVEVISSHLERMINRGRYAFVTVPSDRSFLVGDMVRSLNSKDETRKLSADCDMKTVMRINNKLCSSEAMMFFEDALDKQNQMNFLKQFRIEQNGHWYHPPFLRNKHTTIRVDPNYFTPSSINRLFIACVVAHAYYEHQGNVSKDFKVQVCQLISWCLVHDDVPSDSRMKAPLVMKYFSEMSGDKYLLGGSAEIGGIMYVAEQLEHMTYIPTTLGVPWKVTSVRGTHSLDAVDKSPEDVVAFIRANIITATNGLGSVHISSPEHSNPTHIFKQMSESIVFVLSLCRI
jgi:hypothetical protein